MAWNADNEASKLKVVASMYSQLPSFLPSICKTFVLDQLLCSPLQKLYACFDRNGRQKMQDRRTLPGHRGYLGVGAASQTVDACLTTLCCQTVAGDSSMLAVLFPQKMCRGVESARWALLLAELWQVRFPRH